jgi:hypothetical protein
MKTMHCETPAKSVPDLPDDSSIAEPTMTLHAAVIAVPAGQMLLDSGFPKNDNTSL